MYLPVRYITIMCCIVPLIFKIIVLTLLFVVTDTMWYVRSVVLCTVHQQCSTNNTDSVQHARFNLFFVEKVLWMFGCCMFNCFVEPLFSCVYSVFWFFYLFTYFVKHTCKTVIIFREESKRSHLYNITCW